MKTLLISLTVGAVMSAITAAALLLSAGSAAEPAAGSGELISAAPAEVGSIEPRGLAPRAAPLTAAPAAAFSPADIYERVAPAVVTIVANFSSGGSGFFIDNDGHILTNHHVVEGAASLRVQTWEGETVDAELVGSDPANDLAVIRVDPRQVTISLLGYADSDGVRVGDPVAAIGSPHGFNHSLSTGIVSGLDRTVRSVNAGGRSHYSVVQTDAALNPGNSGGVLVDADGALLGVPFRIESPIRAWTGVAFAISVDTIQRVLPRMLAGEHIRHPLLGIALEADLEITRVWAGSAAHRAGLRAGDVLRRIDGTRVANLNELIATLETLRVGETARVEFSRGGVLHWRTIELEARPSGG